MKRLCVNCQEREAGYPESPHDVLCGPCRYEARASAGWPADSLTPAAPGWNLFEPGTPEWKHLMRQEPPGR